MQLFKKRETLAQNIALMALMAAINIIISVIAAFSPIASALLVLFLPLTSVVVELFCKDRYYPIYAIATIGLSLVATMWNMETTIFYVLPSLATGYLFGLMAKKGIHSMWSIIAAVIVQTGLTFAFIPLIDFMFGVSTIETFKVAFGVSESKYVDAIIPAFIFIISLIQIVLSYIIISNEIKKFGYSTSNGFFSKEWLPSVICLVLCLSLFGFYFVSSAVCYLVLVIALYFLAFVIVRFFEMKYWRTLIICGVIIIANVIVFASAYSLLEKPDGLLLIAFTPLLVSSLDLLVYFLKKPQKKE